jgi:hypothetical protein
MSVIGNPLKVGIVLSRATYIQSKRHHSYREGRLEGMTLKGCNSTGSIAMEITIMRLIEFSERTYGLKVLEFR